MPHFALWACIEWLDGEVVLVTFRDQQCCLFALPIARLPYFVIDTPVPGECLGRPDLDEAFAAVAVIPMGWLNVECGLCVSVSPQAGADARTFCWATCPRC